MGEATNEELDARGTSRSVERERQTERFPQPPRDDVDATEFVRDGVVVHAPVSSTFLPLDTQPRMATPRRQ